MRYRLVVCVLLLALGTALPSAAQFSGAPGSRPRSGNLGQPKISGPSGSFVVLPPVKAADLPQRCEPGRVYEVLDTPDSCALMRCNPDGLDYACLGPTSSGSVTSTAMRLSGTSVDTLRPTVSEASGAFLAGHSWMYAVTVGTGGATITLPDAALPESPGLYKFLIVDNAAGTLTLVPTGTGHINWANTATRAITGRGSGFQCWGLDALGWYCEEIAPAPDGFVTFRITDAKFPTTLFPYIDNSANRTGLVYDNATKWCANFPFIAPNDYAGRFIAHLMYSMPAVNSGNVAMSFAVMKVTPNTNTSLETDSFATANTCIDTVPTTLNAPNFLTCTLNQDDGILAEDFAELQVCREIAHASDTAAGLLKGARLWLTYIKQ